MIVQNKEAAGGVSHQTAYLNSIHYSHNTGYRQYAPYAKRLFSAIKEGYRPRDIFIFLGDFAWEKAEAHSMYHLAIAFPNDANTPNKYIWDFVKGFPVLIFDTSGVEYQTVRWLCYELLKAGSKMIAFVSVNFKVSFFRQNGGC